MATYSKKTHRLQQVEIQNNSNLGEKWYEALGHSVNDNTKFYHEAVRAFFIGGALLAIPALFHYEELTIFPKLGVSLIFIGLITHLITLLAAIYRTRRCMEQVQQNIAAPDDIMQDMVEGQYKALETAGNRDNILTLVLCIVGVIFLLLLYL